MGTKPLISNLQIIHPFSPFSCFICKMDHNSYMYTLYCHGYAYQAHMHLLNQQSQLQQLQEKVEAKAQEEAELKRIKMAEQITQEKLQKAQEQEAQAKFQDRIHYQLCLLAENIEREIKIEYFLACPSHVRRMYYGNAFQTMLSDNSIFEIRDWITNKQAKKSLNRKWRFQYRSDIYKFQQCLQNMRRKPKLNAMLLTDKLPDADFKGCCQLVLYCDNKLIHRSMMYLLKFNDLRKHQHLSRYLL